MSIKIYEVGGCVRDELMGLQSNDVDFAVEAESFAHMKDWLVEEGFEIYIEKPEFLTIKAGVPKSHVLRDRTKVADFVMCRKDGPSSDGRRPDWVEPGTILDDLARRDFTINAIAKDIDGNLIDPFNGVQDCKRGVLCFVGDPTQKIKEDGLRILRGFRFIITKNLSPGYYTERALFAPITTQLNSVSEERIKDELDKMLKFDMIRTLGVFHMFDSYSLEKIFKGRLHLQASLKDI